MRLKLFSLLILVIGCSNICDKEALSYDARLAEFKISYQNDDAITIAVIGDSTSAGFGANSGPKKWTDGLSYGCVNQPIHGPNFDIDSPFYINVVGILTQDQQDNKNIPSAIRLLRTEVELKNLNSKIYNFGGSGYTAGTHVTNSTVKEIALLIPKPRIVFINLGINSAKNNSYQSKDLRVLIDQLIAIDILPILVKPNNIGVANSPTGRFEAASCPNNWHLMMFWQNIRDDIQLIANEYKIAVVDLGQDNTLGDTTLLYDSFHPSAKGYRKIFSIYKDFLEKP